MHRMLIAALSLTLAACSSGGSSATGTVASGGSGSGSSATTTGGGNGGAITVDNFNAAFNDAVCKFEITCSGGVTGPYAPYIDAICPAITFIDESSLPLAVDAGRIRFSVAQATACINALSAANCTELSILPCVPFLSGGDGLVPPAGACYASADCLSGGCTGNVTSTCTAGTCDGLVALGQPCGCPNCGNCDADAGLTCTNSVCTAPATVGQPCDNSNPSCAFPLACVGNICESLPVGAGAPCDPGNGECTAGDYCFEVASASTGSCATQVATGQPCAEDQNHAENVFSLNDNECAGSRPVCLGAGWLLDSGIASGTCSPLSDVGGPCTPPGAAIDAGAPYKDGCYFGLNCVGGACKKPPSSGPCLSTPAIPCDVSVSFCASATNTCTAYLKPGDPCSPSDNDPCGFGVSCNMNSICGGGPPSCTPTL